MFSFLRRNGAQIALEFIVPMLDVGCWMLDVGFGFVWVMVNISAGIN